MVLIRLTESISNISIIVIAFISAMSDVQTEVHNCSVFTGKLANVKKEQLKKGLKGIADWVKGIF